MASTQTLERVTPDDFSDKVLTAGGNRFVVFVTDDPHDDLSTLLTEVVAEAARTQAAHLHAFAANAGQFAELRRQYMAKRTPVHTYNLDKVPVVALFRNGRLITTFEPWIHFLGRRLMKNDIARELDAFLQKMVFFDPAKVKEQKNLEGIE